MLDMVATGHDLRAARHAKELSLKQVADTINEPGFDKTWLSKAELGLLRPNELNIGRIEKAAMLLDVSITHKPSNGAPVPKMRRSRPRKIKSVTLEFDKLADALFACLSVLTCLDRQSQRRVLNYLNTKLS